ncbi:GTPase Era [Dongia deserti]|uniref:GTPase Era n=1 Tax=Dongia deserti TaxID=2268030 RepID=UPI00254698EB|nr:GTPase Era [Dongia deserti]
MTNKEDRSRCGFVALIGAPNAGKSTLLNRLIGAKVSIVSPKVQTTRRRVLGVAMCGNAQVIFVDTPGIFAPRRRLDRAMVAAAWSGAGDADRIVLLVDAIKKKIDADTRAIIEGLKKNGRQAICAINKVDAVKHEVLLKLASELNAAFPFERIFMISAETGDGVEDLMDEVVAHLPEGPHHFPEDQLTDLPVRLLAAEVTREHLFRQLHEEVPYALTVETEAWEEFKDGSAKVSQTIYVARDTHKAIVIGKGGSRIKQVREAAQNELEQMLERKLHLFLFVKVRENWQDDPERYREMGLDFEP